MAKIQKKLEQHPVAKLFPAPDAAALDALRKRIFHAGKLKNSVVLFEGKVIEHWPEYCACLEFDLPYTVTEYGGTAEELVEHLLQTHSAQLGKAHRALIGAYLKKFYRTQSRANQSAGGSGQAFIPKYHAREVAAEKMKISSRLIAEAERILNTGNNNLIGLVLNGTLSISKAAKLAKERPHVLDTLAGLTNEALSQFLPTLDTNKLQSEDRLREEYETEVRKIKAVYKDKRQILNRDMHLRLSLTDTDEEKAQLQEELTIKRRNITELQNIRLEQLQLRYEKKRATLLKTNAKIIRTLRKACQAEVVSQSLEEEAQYLVYMRWDYELGKLSLQAAWDTIQRFDEKTKIHTLKSGRQVLTETEVIAITHTAEIAKATTNAINRKKFCSGQRVLRPNSYVPRVFDRVGTRFMEKVHELITQEK
ncbi:MAG: OmpH family outer membrane protein [Victivallales bacterium]